MSQKNVALLFSSGLDSSYLLYKGVEQGHTMFPIYVHFLNNSNKMKREFAAGYEQIKAVEDHFGFSRGFLLKLSNFCQEGVANNIDFEQRGYEDNSLNDLQSLVWLTSLCYAIDLTNMDEVWIAYVKGDSRIDALDDIRNLYESFKPFMCYEPGELVFPITHKNKRELWNELPERMRENVVFCEKPIGEVGARFEGYPCGECGACQHYVEILPEAFGEYLNTIVKKES